MRAVAILALLCSCGLRVTVTLAREQSTITFEAPGAIPMTITVPSLPQCDHFSIESCTGISRGCAPTADNPDPCLTHNNNVIPL